MADKNPRNKEMIAKFRANAGEVSGAGLGRLIHHVQHASDYSPQHEITVEKETESSAHVCGGFHHGVVVAKHATQLAIKKAKASGVGIVVADGHRNSATLSHYVEEVARADLVALAVAIGNPNVAPHGANAARVGTNPITLGFPSTDQPIVWDISTSSVSWSELRQISEENGQLPENVGLDREGLPTGNPEAVLQGGALLPWGGHKGSGLAISIQLLGLLCDLPAFPAPGDGTGFLIIAIDPSIFLPTERFKERTSELARGIRSTKPAEGFEEVRMPYDRSLAERERQLREGMAVPRTILDELSKLAPHE